MSSPLGDHGLRSLNREDSAKYTITITYRDKTRVQMFSFDSNTTVPLQYDALAFLESVC